MIKQHKTKIRTSNNLCLSFMLFLLTFLPIAYADTFFNATFSINSLPIFDKENFLFSLSVNSSIFFNLTLDSPKINLSFEANITLDENTTIANLTVNYSIGVLTGYSGNSSSYIEAINVTNSINNNSVILYFNFTILHPQAQGLSLTLIDNKKVTLIKTFTRIEYITKDDITLEASLGSIVNISCGDYITCPPFINCLLPF